jgi:hypothetical protein
LAGEFHSVNAERIKAGIDRIKKTLEDYTDGWANEKARSEIFNACNSMEWECDSSYVKVKIGYIRIAADNLYAARKHNKFKQGSSSGVDVLRAEIHSLLIVIEDQLNEFSRLGIISNTQPPTEL